MTLADERVYAFERLSRDRGEGLLVVLNRDAAAPVEAKIAPAHSAAGALAELDPLTGASRPVEGGRLRLPASGVRVVHPA